MVQLVQTTVHQVQLITLSWVLSILWVVLQLVYKLTKLIQKQLIVMKTSQLGLFHMQ